MRWPILDGMTTNADEWQITLPDGVVLIFPDWQSARIEAEHLTAVHGMLLVADRVPRLPERGERQPGPQSGTAA